MSTIDGHSNNGTGSATTLGVTITTTANNDILYVLIGINSGSATSVTANAPTDNATGNTWTKRVSGTSVGGGFDCDAELWSTTWASHGTVTITVTVTPSNASAIALVAWGVSGGNTSAFDGNGSVPASATGSGATASTTMSTNNANDLLITAVMYRGNPTLTVGGSFLEIDDGNGNTGAAGTSVTIDASYLVVSSTQSSLGLSYTSSNAFNWNIFGDAVMQATGASTTQPSVLLYFS